jgi:hypothetical protein
MVFCSRVLISSHRFRALALAAAAVISLSLPLASRAQSTALGSATGPSDDRWYFQTSLYTKHFSVNPLHDNSQRLLNLEYWRSDNYLAGLALFDNSFGQRSQYAYVGKVWRPFDLSPKIYLKLTGGLLHGYKDEFKDKIPFNRGGIAPALVPSIGYTWGRLNSELVLFGTAGLMINLGLFF